MPINNTSQVLNIPYKDTGNPESHKILALFSNENYIVAALGMGGVIGDHLHLARFDVPSMTNQFTSLLDYSDTNNPVIETQFIGILQNGSHVFLTKHQDSTLRLHVSDIEAATNITFTVLEDDPEIQGYYNSARIGTYLTNTEIYQVIYYAVGQQQKSVISLYTLDGTRKGSVIFPGSVRCISTNDGLCVLVSATNSVVVVRGTTILRTIPSQYASDVIAILGNGMVVMENYSLS